jgi:hypothetical protein
MSDDPEQPLDLVDGDNYSAGVVTKDILDNFDKLFDQLTETVVKHAPQVEVEKGHATDVQASLIATCLCLTLLASVRKFGPLRLDQINFGVHVGIQRAGELLGVSEAQPIDQAPASNQVN